MHNLELLTHNLGKVFANLLVISLILWSLRAWVMLLRGYRRGKTWLEMLDEPRVTWTRFPEVMALAVVLVMLVMHLAVKFEPSPAADRELMTMPKLLSNLATTGGIVLLLLAMLSSSNRAIGEFGFHRRSFLAQVRDGRDGFSLALLPTAILMAATAPLRNVENQNSLLTLLSNAEDSWTVVAVCFAAIVIAPLYEELMFRVILQGWLTTHLKPIVAIPIVAVAFAAIHAPADAIALLPLACVLGYVFHRRHSYVAVLVIHGLFNATMLELQLLMAD